MRLPTPLLDVFCNVLILYIFYTILAFSALNEAPERTLPPIDLAQTTERTAGGLAGIEPLTISVKAGKEGQVTYFLNDRAVLAEELRTRLQEMAPREVTLRIDEQVRYGETIPLLGILHDLKVRSLAFAYRVTR